MFPGRALYSGRVLWRRRRGGDEEENHDDDNGESTLSLPSDSDGDEGGNSAGGGAGSSRAARRPSRVPPSTDSPPPKRPRLKKRLVCGIDEALDPEKMPCPKWGPCAPDVVSPLAGSTWLGCAQTVQSDRLLSKWFPLQMRTAYTLSQCSVISNLCECLQVKSHISLPAELLFWPNCLTRLHGCGMHHFRLLFRIPLVIKTRL